MIYGAFRMFCCVYIVYTVTYAHVKCGQGVKYCGLLHVYKTDLYIRIIQFRKSDISSLWIS